MVASKKDVEMAKSMFGFEGDITEYIVDLGVSVENTTRAKADALHSKRRHGKGGRKGWPERA